MIYNYIYPDMTIKNAGLVAMGASSMLSRASTLVNFGCGEEEQRKQFIEKKQEEYRDEEKGTLNRNGQKYLNKLYVKNEEFREEIINFVRDKKN